jgi:hypothetical protein
MTSLELKNYRDMLDLETECLKIYRLYALRMIRKHGIAYEAIRKVKKDILIRIGA